MESGTIIIIMLLGLISLQLMSNNKQTKNIERSIKTETTPVGKLTVKVTADTGEFMRDIKEVENALNRIKILREGGS